MKYVFETIKSHQNGQTRGCSATDTAAIADDYGTEDKKKRTKKKLNGNKTNRL